MFYSEKNMYFLFLFCLVFFQNLLVVIFSYNHFCHRYPKKNIRIFMSHIFCAPKMVALEEVKNVYDS